MCVNFSLKFLTWFKLIIMKCLFFRSTGPCDKEVRIVKTRATVIILGWHRLSVFQGLVAMDKAGCTDDMLLARR